jgi:phosphoribosylformylglycinamidine synthase
MTPYEVMLSESQERMLCIVEKGKEDEITAIFSKWGLNSVVIGEVTDDDLVHVYEGDELVAEVKAKSLVDECPTYEMQAEEPGYIKEVQAVDVTSYPEPDCYCGTLKALLASPNIASKEWVYHQYDHMVQLNSVVMPGSDAAVLRIKGTRKGVATSTDCNARYVYLDPYMGGMIAVAEAARNVACTGAEPLGLTNCLNFGNPEKPEAFWQFRRAVEGIAAACRHFEIPVTGGNVSFYNETPEMAIYPTPVIGMVGLMDDIDARCTQNFKEEGDVVVLVGDYPVSGIADLGLGGSEYLAVVHNVEAGMPPSLDLNREAAVQNLVRDAVRKGLLASTHDCSEGGLAISIAESCITGKQGANITLPVSEYSLSAQLFGEKQSRVVVSVKKDNLEALMNMARTAGVPVAVLGEAGGNELKIQDSGKNAVVTLSVDEIESTWRGAIECMMS